MTGLDVAAWQHFLIRQSLFAGAVDAVYGPETAKSTKGYQQNKGLDVDGIVGPALWSAAITDGFEPPPGHVAVRGMDTSVDCTRFAASLPGEGMRFVVRYYTSEAGGKRLSRREALALSQAGLQVMVVMQDANNTIDFFSSARGQEHAATALKQAAALGQPAGTAIYFATDFDPNAAGVRGPISDYFHAVAQAFANAPVRYAVGVYGSGLTCRLIRDAGLATYTWLSGSMGYQESHQFRPQADLIQIAPSRKICGGKLWIDDDIAQCENFGAFQITTAPPGKTIIAKKHATRRRRSHS